MELTPAQSKIVSDQHRFRVLVCGRKFGKTTISIYEMIGAAISHSNKRILYIAPTFGDARRLVWDKLLNILGQAAKRVNEQRMEITVRSVTGHPSSIFLGSWELVNNYRGDEYDLIIFDEAQEYRNFWEGWHEAMRPTLTPRQGKALFMGTPKGFNHLYDLYNTIDTDYQSFKFTTYDNPFIPIEEIEKAKKELTPDRFAQEYLADFRKSEGLVFKEFSRETHIYEHEVTGERVGGIDFGYVDPAAILEVIIKDGVYYVQSELYKTQMTDIQIAEYAAAMKFSKVYPDPAAPEAIKELKNLRVNVRDVIKSKDSIRHGIDKIRELFKANKLFIHSSCRNLIMELESYAYEENREQPKDENNHAIDALRYVVMMHITGKPYVPLRFYDRNVEIWNNR